MAKRNQNDVDQLDEPDLIEQEEQQEPVTVSTGDAQGYAAPKAAPKTSKSKEYPITLLVVSVDRGHGTSPSTTIPEYELAVLEAIHGDDGPVQVVSEREGTTTMNAAQAHAAMLNKYNQNKDDVKAVYPRPSKLAKVSGLPYQDGDDAAAKYQTAQFIDHSQENQQETFGE
jgi:hypothetical protein